MLQCSAVPSESGVDRLNAQQSEHWHPSGTGAPQFLLQIIRGHADSLRLLIRSLGRSLGLVALFLPLLLQRYFADFCGSTGASGGFLRYS